MPSLGLGVGLVRGRASLIQGPALGRPPSETVYAGQASVGPYPITVDLPGGSAASVNLSGSSSDSSVVSAVTPGGSGANRTVTLTMGAGTGTATITLTATAAGRPSNVTTYQVTRSTAKTLSMRETFAADRSSGALGSFTTWPTGTGYAGLSSGPRAPGEVRRTGAFRYPTQAEKDGATLITEGTYTLPTITSAGQKLQQLVCWARVARPQSATLGYGGAHFFSCFNQANGNHCAVQVTAYSSTTDLATIGVSTGGTVVFSTTVTVRPDEWFQTAICYDHNSAATGTYTVYVYFRRVGDAAWTLLQQNTYSGASFIPTTLRVRHGGTGAAAGIFGGQIGSVSVYLAPDVAGLSTIPLDVVDPNGTPASVSVDSATGNDATVFGPWATADKVVTAVSRCILRGTPDGWVDDTGAAAGWLQTTDTASRRAWIESGFQLGKRAAAGDRVTFTAGQSWRLTAPFALYGMVRGLWIKSSVAGTPFTLLTDEAVAAGATWTPDVTFTTVYKYGGTVRAKAAWWQDADKKALWPIFAADLATAKPLLAANPGSYYPDPATGDNWVCALGSVNPNTTSWERWSGIGSFDWSGCQVDDCVMDGGLAYTPTVPGETDPLDGNYQFGVTCLPVITVFRRCVGKRFAKHCHALTGTNLTGLVYREDCDGILGPLAQVNANVGFFAGASSAGVDFCATAGPGTIVSYWKGYDSRPQRALQGSGGSVGNDVGGGSRWLAHDSGGGGQPIALVVFRDSYMPVGQYSVPGASVVALFDLV